MASQPISRSGHASTIDRIGKEGFPRKSYKDEQRDAKQVSRATGFVRWVFSVGRVDVWWDME